MLRRGGRDADRAFAPFVPLEPGRRGRGRAALIAFALVAPLALLPGPTAATWTSSQVVTAPLAAATLKQPVITDCTYSHGLVGIGASMSVSWTFQGAVYTPTATVRQDGDTSVTTELPSSTITQNGGVYTLKVTKGLLTGLLEFLGGVLFGNKPFTVTVTGRLPDTSWVTEPAQVFYDASKNCS